MLMVAEYLIIFKFGLWVKLLVEMTGDWLNQCYLRWKGLFIEKGVSGQKLL